MIPMKQHHSSLRCLLGRLFAIGFIMSAISSTSFAQNLVNQDFEGFAPGTELTFGTTFPWGMRDGGGTTPTPSSVVVQEETIASMTSNWALVSNSATDEPAANPLLAGIFTDSGHLEMSFSVMIPSDFGNSSQLLFTLGYFDGGSWTSGIEIYLGPNFQSQNHWLGYRTSLGDRVDVGSGTSQAGERMDIVLSNVNSATGTYDLSWTSSNGGNGAATGIAVTNALATDWNYVSWGENSAITSISSIYVDDIVVNAIPEPAMAQYALIFGGGLLLFMRNRRRC